LEFAFDLLVTLVAVAVVSQYTWSGRGHFQSDKMPLGSMVISLTVIVTSLFDLSLIWTAAQPVVAQLIGLVTMIAAGVFFWVVVRESKAARLRLAFDEQGPRSLVMTGPYAYVRHPFYTSYIVFWAGLAISTWSIIAIFPFAILVVIYVFAAQVEEGKFARSAMAEEYAAYKARTGRFWPRLG
jgi:protein-S-isoprenylcysteine O-methyltransferase Ste14